MDPASASAPQGEADIRPSVGSASRQMPLWILVTAVVAAGAILFVILDGRRRAMNAPAVKAQRSDLAASPPVPLYIPPAYVPEPAPVAAALPVSAPPPASPPQSRAAPPAEPQIVYVPQPAPQSGASPPPARRDASPILVIDNGGSVRGAGAPATPDAAAAPRQGGAAAAPAMNTNRARAGAFANRANTILQGTLIPAVLESALDSTRAGFARAIVSRDVRGFDGTQVLIPRGSRLIGEYGSDNGAGQKRALITWTRLIRPDGVTIAIQSPVADTLGRTGVRAKVNTHFWERFSGAILQSALDIGVNIASREAGAPTVIALPGANVTAQAVQPQQITPTLTVKPGTSISVFVARDLDFTGAENRR